VYLKLAALICAVLVAFAVGCAVKGGVSGNPDVNNLVSSKNVVPKTTPTTSSRPKMHTYDQYSISVGQGLATNLVISGVCVSGGNTGCTDSVFWSVVGEIEGANVYPSPAISVDNVSTNLYVSTSCSTPLGSYNISVIGIDSNSTTPFDDEVNINVVSGICHPTPPPTPMKPAAQRIIEQVNQIVDQPGSGICGNGCAKLVNLIALNALGHTLSVNDDASWVPYIAEGITGKGYGHLLQASTTAAGAAQAVPGDIVIQDGYDYSGSGFEHVGICMNKGCTIVASNGGSVTSDGTCHMDTTNNTFSDPGWPYDPNAVTAFYHITN